MRFTLRWRYKPTYMCTHATLWPLTSLLSAHTPSPLCWHKSSWSIAPLGLDPPNYPVFILLLFLQLPRPSLSAYQLPFRVGGNACWVMRDSGRTNLSLIALKGHSLTHTYPHLHTRISWHRERLRSWMEMVVKKERMRKERGRVCVYVLWGSVKEVVNVSCVSPGPVRRVSDSRTMSAGSIQKHSCCESMHGYVCPAHGKLQLRTHMVCASHRSEHAHGR